MTDTTTTTAATTNARTPARPASRPPTNTRGIRLPLSPRTRRLVLLVHIAAAGTWLGLDLVLGILVLTAFALLLDALVGRIERRLMKWQPRAGETEKL